MPRFLFMAFERMRRSRSEGLLGSFLSLSETTSISSSVGREIRRRTWLEMSNEQVTSNRCSNESLVTSHKSLFYL